jgi:glycosyltransferase involved in cell wall biosynthesis
MLINLTIPVYNEEVQLRNSIRKLHAFLTVAIPCSFEIVIANNASTDGTREISNCLSLEYSNVHALHLTMKGRGRALKRAWTESSADILSYMDVDLSTDITYFPGLIQLLNQGADISIGSRLSPESKVARGIKREVISRGYNILLKAFFSTSFPDAQCGFKAITRAAAREILPIIEDNGWFFDSELLTIAENRGYKIKSLPVAWVDDPDSRVKIIATALEDIKGMIRVKRKFLRQPKRRTSEAPSVTTAGPL